MEKELGAFIRTVKRMIGMDTRTKVPSLVARPGMGLPDYPKAKTVKTSEVTTNVTPDLSTSHHWPEAKIYPNEFNKRSKN